MLKTWVLKFELMNRVVKIHDPRVFFSVDQHDAFSVAEWMRRADLDGTLSGFFDPSLSPAERMVAQVEGWILGIK